jgi:hypothetical protein
MRGLGLFLGMRRRRAGGPSLVAVPSPLASVIENVSDFTAGSGWLATAATVSDNAVPSYSGAGSADRTRSDGSTGAHGLGRTGNALVMGVVYYADFVVKPDGRNHMLIQISGVGLNHYAMVDLAGNNVGDTLAIDDWTVSDLSNGWKFVRLEFTAGAGVVHACNLFHAVGTNVASDFGAIVGDITKGLLLDRYVLSRNP